MDISKVTKVAGNSANTIKKAIPSHPPKYKFVEMPFVPVPENVNLHPSTRKYFEMLKINWATHVEPKKVTISK